MPYFDNTYYRQLSGFYTEVEPSPLQRGRLLYHNQPLADQLGLSAEWWQSADAGVCLGESLLEGMQPIAQVYSGHQFGQWAGQLGDGRGLLLGEQRLSNGKKVDWHLKGAGLTPYSRMGDGRSVLRSAVREFLASEALHGLGIPTTRALSVSTSQHAVQREQQESGAMLVRIAETHLRFGHFEHFYYRQQPENVRRLTDYAIEHHWPDLINQADRYFLWFSDVVKRTAQLIAAWQAVGFAHGVMNTDNMSILGITIDFGPFGFLDDYQPDFICNHSDYQGRYSFENQPSVAYWNLHRLAQALSDLLPTAQLQQALARYEPELLAAYGQKMRAKLGLQQEAENDYLLLNQLLNLMHLEKQDYTQTFRLLADVEQNDPQCRLRDHFIDRPAFDGWLSQYRQRLQQESLPDMQRQQQMNSVNPHAVLRNYLAQNAIQQAEQGDNTALAHLHQGLMNPFMLSDEFTDLAALPPDWGKHLAISCSS